MGRPFLDRSVLLRRAARIAGWIGLALIAIVIVAAGAVIVVVRTDRFRAWLRDQVVTTLNAGWNGELAVGRLDGSIFGDLTLHDVRLRHQGVDVLVVPEVGLGYALLPLASGRVEVTRIDVVDPIADLRQDAEARWNVLEALAAKVVEPEPAPAEDGFVIDLRKITLVNGTITVAPAGQPTVHLRGVVLDATAEMNSKGTVADVRRLEANAEREGVPPLRLAAALSYEGREPPHVLEVRSIAVETPLSKATFHGNVSGLDVIATDRARVTVDASLALERIAGAELATYLPQWKPADEITGKLDLRGPLSALDADLTVLAVGARLAAHARADVAAETPSYEANAEIAKLDLARVVETVRGVVDATLTVRGKGFEPSGVAGDARAVATGLAWDQHHADTVTISGRAENERVTFDVDAANGPGRITARGDAAIAAEPNGRLELTVANWKVGATNEVVERARVVGQASDGLLKLAEASLTAKGATANARGELGLRAGRSGRLVYDAKAQNLQPWLALAGRTGTGTLVLTGTASGSVADLALGGALDIAPLCDEAVSIRRLRLDYSVAHLGGDRPEGRASLAIVEFGGPLHFEKIGLKTTFSGAKATRIAFELDLEGQGRRHRVRTSAELVADGVRTSIAELALELPDGVWKLESPATIVTRGNAFEVDRVSLANGDRRIWIAGKAGLAGPQSLALAVERFPMTNLKPLLGESLALDGAIATKVTIAGTAAAPTIDVTADVSDLQVSGVRYDGLHAVLRATPSATTLDAAFRQDATHALTVVGTLPVRMSWDGTFRSDFAGDVDLRARSPGLSLAFLNLAGEKLVREASGELSVDVLVRGPVTDPTPTGSFAVRDTKLFVVPAGVDFQDIVIEGTLDRERISIPKIQIVSGKGGSAGGSAEIALAGRAPSAIRATIEAWHFAPVYRKEAWAKVSGKITVEGSMSSPKIGGEVLLEEAIIRPDLEFLGKAPKPRDPTIHVVPIGVTEKPVESACAKAIAASTPAGAPAAEPAAFDYALDVGVKILGNAWIKHAQATVELTGDVRATKGLGDVPRLIGAIETRRGWAELQGKRFEVTTGKIAFTGGDEIDPNLDIVGAYKTSDYVVEAVIGGTANRPSLELRSDPPLEQADILSVLLFGKPTNQLSEGEQTALSDRAAEIAAGFAVTAVGQAVARKLGFEEAGIHIEELSTSRVALGKYISEKTFVTVAQTLDEEPGQEVAIEYRFFPEWSFVTSSATTGNNAADIIWKKQY